MSGVSANDVAAELRRRLPDLGVKKLHKLLYYCQGHHLAATGHPLFTETVSAWDMGPVVGELWFQEREGLRPIAEAEMDEAQLNTVGYVVNRYGALSAADLERLTHNEPPWRNANTGRRPRTSARIPVQALLDYFAWADDEQDDAATPVPDTDAVSSWLREVGGPPVKPRKPDSIEALRARLTNA